MTNKTPTTRRTTIGLTVKSAIAAVLLSTSVQAQDVNIGDNQFIGFALNMGEAASIAGVPYASTVMEGLGVLDGFLGLGLGGTDPVEESLKEINAKLDEVLGIVKTARDGNRYDLRQALLKEVDRDMQSNYNNVRAQLKNDYSPLKNNHIASAELDSLLTHHVKPLIDISLADFQTFIDNDSDHIVKSYGVYSLLANMQITVALEKYNMYRADQFNCPSSGCTHSIEFDRQNKERAFLQSIVAKVDTINQQIAQFKANAKAFRTDKVSDIQQKNVYETRRKPKWCPGSFGQPSMCGSTPYQVKIGTDYWFVDEAFKHSSDYNGEKKGLSRSHSHTQSSRNSYINGLHHDLNQVFATDVDPVVRAFSSIKNAANLEYEFTSNEEISIFNSDEPFIHDATYHARGMSYNGLPIYEHPENVTDHSDIMNTNMTHHNHYIFQRDNGHWVLAHAVEELWRHTIRYSDSVTPTPWGSTWVSGMSVHPAH